jgi:uncharacterized membrane protein
MAILKLAFAHEVARPMFAMVFASAVCVGLVIARVAWTHNVDYFFLLWNLFLAWLPLVPALLAVEYRRKHLLLDWRLAALSFVWLLLFPNAPYIFTDIIHLTRGFQAHFWVDLALFLSCAFTGLVLGFVSLYLMQSVVRQMYGPRSSWCFVALVAALSGLGIYFGRFLRFNSWDIIVRPVELSRSLGKWAAQPLANSHPYAFPVLFAIFVFITYLMLYALTHLRQPHSSGSNPAQPVPADSAVNGPVSAP